jgi:hypothetical protein
MATKKRKAPKRKARPARRPAQATVPAWLTQLRDEVFSDPGFPEVESDFHLPDGTPAVRQRAIVYTNTLYYVETWREVHTLDALFRWRQALDLASFLSVPPTIRQHAIATLRQTMRQAQPQWPRVMAPRSRALAHEAFGRRPRRWL